MLIDEVGGDEGGFDETDVEGGRLDIDESGVDEVDVDEGGVGEIGVGEGCVGECGVVEGGTLTKLEVDERGTVLTKGTRERLQYGPDEERERPCTCTVS
jgi:hypothetical protein